MHGYTYSGHPAACAALIATLQIYASEHLFERARGLETYWEEAVHMLRQAPNVADVRNIGLVGGIELKPLEGRPGARGSDVYRRAFDGGLLVRVTGDTIAMSPPLIISESRSTRSSRSSATRSRNRRRSSHDRNLAEEAVLGGAAATLGAWPARGLASSDPRSADLIVRNARVYTMEPSAPAAQAFAVRDGHIIAVGSNDAIGGLAGAGSEAFDARGMTIVPGFIDCHLHPEGESLLYDVLVGNPYEVEFVTIDSIVAKLKARAAKTPPGQWVQGYFYDDTKVKDGRPLTRRRSRSRVQRSSGGGCPPRRAHGVRQQQGVRACRHYQGHAATVRRHVRP